jgi:hypothetical protein
MEILRNLNSHTTASKEIVWGVYWKWFSVQGNLCYLTSVTMKSRSNENPGIMQRSWDIGKSRFSQSATCHMRSKIIETAKRHIATIWPSYHQMMKSLALMVTEIWSGNEIYDVKWNFKMATFLGGRIGKKTNRTAHFHPEPTIKIWWSFGDHLGVMQWNGHAQPTVRNNMVLSFLLRRSGTIAS